MEKQFTVLREGEDAGHVWDSAGNAWRSTYNQGTFLGAAIMLYEKYGTQQYYDDACNVMANTVKNLCYNNILKEENTNSGDLSGMRGILMRYMRKFIVDFNKGEYLSFFKDNARVAWMNSNSKGIMQCSWQKKHLKTQHGIHLRLITPFHLWRTCRHMQIIYKEMLFKYRSRRFRLL